MTSPTIAAFLRLSKECIKSISYDSIQVLDIAINRSYNKGVPKRERLYFLVHLERSKSQNDKDRSK